MHWFVDDDDDDDDVEKRVGSSWSVRTRNVSNSRLSVRHVCRVCRNASVYALWAARETKDLNLEVIL